MPALELIHSLSGISQIESVDDSIDIDHNGFISNIKINSITLRYENKDTIALNDVNLEIKPGKSVAIVGPSGAGKTSLVDVILGVLLPDSGSVLISGKKSLDAIATWPGAISYVPQDIKISNGSIRENVALVFPHEEITNDLVWQALDSAQLKNFVHGLPKQLDTQVGENGTKLSGGQRQRLGIARAMFTKPMLLVLDEATSSLDGQTESDISEAISNLKGTVTVIVIAHRLSTIRNSDQVIYMNGGKIIYQGTFDEVRKAVPDFDRQAELIGL